MECCDECARPGETERINGMVACMCPPCAIHNARVAMIRRNRGLPRADSTSTAAEARARMIERNRNAWRTT